MTIRNRELSQFGSFIYIQNDTKDIGITTEATPYVGIGTTNATEKFHVVGKSKLEGDVEITGSILGDEIVFANSDGTETYATYSNNGSVKLYYDNQLKLETIGTGVSIYNDLYVGTGVSIFGDSGIIRASQIYIGDNLITESPLSAGTATSLATARDFSITGDFVTAPTISFDGISDVAFAATITENSIILGTYTSGDYVESVSGITNQVEISGGTGEGSAVNIGLSSNLVLPGNLEVNGISTFNGITTFTTQVYTENVSSGVISATSYYLNGSLLVDASLEPWEPALIDSPTSIYRNQGNVGIGTSIALYKLSVNGRIESQAPQGTPPLVVRSRTLVSNLNADLLDGKHAPTGDIVGATDTQTLTNKTLTSPTISQIINGGTQLIPSGTGTLVSTTSVGVITTGMLGNIQLFDEDISPSAGIQFSKISTVGVGNSIENGDIADGTIQNVKLVNSTISGVSLGSNLYDLIKGDYITFDTGSTYNGTSDIIIGVAATTINTANTLIARDSSGDFTAGSANLFGITLSGGYLNLNDGNVEGNGNITIGGTTTSYGGFNIGIQSGGVNIATGALTAINFIGVSGNAIEYNEETKTVDISIISETAGSLSLEGDTGGLLSIDLITETLTLAGTPNEINTVGSGNTITIGLPNEVVVGTSLSSPTIKTSTIQHSNGTQAATIDTSGNIIASQNLTVTGDLFVNGSTTQVNTVSLTVEDRTIELGIVDGAAPSSPTTWDLGVLFNYHDGAAKKSALVWEQADARFKLGSVVTDGGGTGNSNPQITLTTYAALEIADLWINNTCTGGSTQVIGCIGDKLNLQNITVDAGTF